MASEPLLSLRDRMAPASEPRRNGAAAKRPDVDRVLRLAADLFGVAAAALVLADGDGFAVGATSGTSDVAGAVEAARRLFDTLAESGSPDAGRPAGVMEELAPGRGFVAATPVLSPAGRCLGAVCLLDGDRRTLLTRLQRRLFSEFGDLVIPPPDPAGARPGVARATGNGARLQSVADAHADAFALFDPDGRCLLRNAHFDALLGTAGPVSAPVPPDAEGCEAGWIAHRLARDLSPVGVYRAALPDGTWLGVEERRGPLGRSLLARVDGRDAFGGDGEMQQLFERCPFPMFVFDRDTRAVLAANEAALSLYGWDRDAFLRLDLDGIGPVDPAAPAAPLQGWTHRTRDGRRLAVSGRSVALAHRGRPAVLVTVTGQGSPDHPPHDRAA